jgi:hypothetical protein
MSKIAEGEWCAHVDEIPNKNRNELTNRQMLCLTVALLVRCDDEYS